MRLALLIYASLETLSGGYLYDRRVVEHLRRCGDTVEIVSLPWRSYPAHLGDNLSPALLERLRALECDALLQDELNHPSLFLLNDRLRRSPLRRSPLRRSPLRRPPIFSIVHHLRVSEARPAWQNRWMGRVERRYLESVDGFIFNGETTRQSVYRLAPGVQARPYVVARPAGDRFNAHGAPPAPGEVQARAARPGPLRVAFVGNLIPRKGLHTLLDALARLPQDCCTLQVVGDPQVDPAYSRAIREQIDRLGLAGRVELCGRLDEAPLAGVLRSAQALAVPSFYEGYGIVYLEGMGWGLPAIAGADGGAREIIAHGRNGYLVNPGDAETLAEHLRRLASDRGLLAEMSLAALETFARSPTWEACGENIRKFLREQIRQE